MIKVSFKKDCKEVKVEGNTTTVTLKGDFAAIDEVYSLSFPYWLQKSKNEWVTVTAEGKAKRSPEDEDNPILAERIAEARAKMKIYRKAYKLIEDFLDEVYKVTEGKSFHKIHKRDNNAIVEVLHKKSKGLMKDYFKHRLLYNKELNHLKELIHGTGNTSTGKP